MISGRARATGLIFVMLSFSLASSSAQMQTKASEADSTAVKQVVANYDNAFNQHDAHGVGALFAEEGDFTNMRGASRHGRKDIEQNYGNLFAGGLKSSHRTDTVKNVRFLTPEIAQVDADWEMAGTKAADGSDNPTRKGYLDWVVAKVNGQWLIVVFHESEFPK
jgi:uncharacterized protein (TIGR02246 family)